MEGEAWGMSTHPSQSQCASASDDGTVRFWDLKAHRQTAVLSIPGRKARAIGHSHDGSAVAIGFMDGERERDGEREGGREGGREEGAREGGQGRVREREKRGERKEVYLVETTLFILSKVDLL